jgi:hypothetical protein
MKQRLPELVPIDQGAKDLDLPSDYGGEVDGRGPMGEPHQDHTPARTG